MRPEHPAAVRRRARRRVLPAPPPLAALLGAALLASGTACRSRSPAPAFAPHRGPVLLITVDALRADAVGPRLMPNLHRFAEDADWAGTAVAPSSWTVPSMASIFTGLQPWSHGVLHPGRARLPEGLPTLPERMQAAGLATAGFHANHWLGRKFGYGRGFTEFRRTGEGERPADFLSRIDGRPRFVWVHVLPPHAPYVRWEALLGRLDDPPADLPPKVRPRDLEPYYDPDVPIPPDRLRVFRAMYELNAGHADEIVGRVLAALRSSGHWDDALVVVTADHGEEFGENGQTGHGGNLGRPLIEVPLAVKLPRGFGGRLAVEPAARPGTVRLFSTLLAAVGAAPPPGAAPDLFRQGARPVLSELYLGNGHNDMSLLDGDWQLLWRSWFAAPDPDYYRARVLALGDGDPSVLPRPPEAIFSRLQSAFEAAPPLGGGTRPPDRWLEHWTAAGTERVEDSGRGQRMAHALAAAWRDRDGPDRPPGAGDAAPLDDEDLRRLRALGYVGSTKPDR